jgi:hypothetical protein
LGDLDNLSAFGPQPVPQPSLVLEALLLEKLQVLVILCHRHGGIQLPSIERGGVAATDESDEIRG